MIRFAVRLLTLAICAMALGAVPMTTPAKAATDSSTPAKKKHKKMHPAGAQTQVPVASPQYPRNMSDDPDRKPAGY